MDVKIEQTLKEIDIYNSKDPVREKDNRKDYGKEQLYGIRMSECLNEFAPLSSDLMKIACRAQHIGRWEIKRNDYPIDRKGYHQWRIRLYGHHAGLCGEIMLRNGYTQKDVAYVAELMAKNKIKKDKDAQLFEDVVCLVFLKHYFEDFYSKYDEEKMIGIVQKTWAKMSDKAHEKALALSYSEEAYALIKKALA